MSVVRVNSYLKKSCVAQVGPQWEWRVLPQDVEPAAAPGVYKLK